MHSQDSSSCVKSGIPQLSAFDARVITASKGRQYEPLQAPGKHITHLLGDPELIEEYCPVIARSSNAELLGRGGWALPTGQQGEEVLPVGCFGSNSLITDGKIASFSWGNSTL